jgi:hypothetical protein
VDGDGLGDACDYCAAIANPTSFATDACGLLTISSLRIALGKEANEDAITVKGRFDAAVAGRDVRCGRALAHRDALQGRR